MDNTSGSRISGFDIAVHVVEILDASPTVLFNSFDILGFLGCVVTVTPARRRAELAHHSAVIVPFMQACSAEVAVRHKDGIHSPSFDMLSQILSVSWSAYSWLGVSPTSSS